jgi:hypothetical protein
MIQSISWSGDQSDSKTYIGSAICGGCTWTLSSPRLIAMLTFACFRGHFEARNWPLWGHFRLGATRHSISHTRKLLKQMRNQNGIDSYCGSTFSQIGNRLRLTRHVNRHSRHCYISEHRTSLSGHTKGLNKQGMRLTRHGNKLSRHGNTLPRYVNMLPRHYNRLTICVSRPTIHE